jgi:hypothetical protein
MRENKLKRGANLRSLIQEKHQQEGREKERQL